MFFFVRLKSKIRSKSYVCRISKKTIMKTIKTNNLRNIGLVIGGLTVATMGSASLAAELFQLESIGSGGEVRANLTSDISVPSPVSEYSKLADGKCGENKCGEKKAESKSKEAKCGEAKCGEKKAESKSNEAKCGEAKCGEKKAESKSNEAKCGEAKCGEKKTESKTTEAKCGK